MIHKIIQINQRLQFQLLNYIKQKENIKYLYFSDFDTAYSININIFICNDKYLSRYNINEFIINKIFSENYNLIVYEFNNLKSLLLIGDMFFNTRVYNIQTIIIYPNKLPPSYRENLDIYVKN